MRPVLPLTQSLFLSTFLISCIAFAQLPDEDQRHLDYQLTFAIRENKPASNLLALIKKGARPNGDALTELALHFPVRPKRIEYLNLLLQNGGDPNHQRDIDTSTPLMFASSFCYFEAVKIMLEYGGNPDKPHESYRFYSSAIDRAADALIDIQLDQDHSLEEKSKRISSCTQTVNLLKAHSKVTVEERKAHHQEELEIFKQVCELDKAPSTCVARVTEKLNARERILAK